MIRKSVRLLTLPAILLLLPLLLQQAVMAEPEEPEAKPRWTAPIPITSPLSGASPLVPVVAASPDGRTVMIVYNREMSTTNHDPWFSRSTNNGATWSTPRPIRSSNVDSVQVYITYDATGRAHAVWREGNDLAYANDSNWASTFKLISTPGNLPPGASNPVVVATGPDRVDVVWSEGVANPDIYHRRSIDGGSNWLARSSIAVTAPSSLVPTLAIDANGFRHVVWEEHEAPGQARGTIYYARWKPGDTNWTVKARVSGTHDGRQPKIAVGANNTLHVTYTRFVSQSQQYVQHLQCQSGCTNPLNWSNPIGSNPVSGADALAAKSSDPFDVISAVTTHRGCTLVYFHGIQAGQINERALGVNSCGGWSAGGRDVVPSPGPRSLHPSITTQNNWWVYLVYEVAGATRQVYFVRNQPAVYLPIIRR